MDNLSASAYVDQGFNTIRPFLAAFVGQEMLRTAGSNWWQDAVLSKLSETFTRNLPQQGKWDELVDRLDVMACFQLIDRNWNEIFKYKMTAQQRTWNRELMNTRNEWAHLSGGGMDESDASRALDTMARLMEPIDQENAEELRKLMRQVRYNTEGASTEAPSVSTIKPEVTPVTTTYGYVRPWKQIAEPHPDVAKGIYRQAEFAADLSQVLRGVAMPEYQDPVEFFARTYITDGMRGMLIKAAQRVAGKGGEPVIQLKTAFGGGKTHSMLALYHMMRAPFPEKLQGIPNVLADARITSMPKVKVAVLVGTFLDPAKNKRPINFPGITINTLWGEIAAQLAEQSNNPKLYEYVKEADKKGVSPGSDTLRQLFDACAPCLILIDELVSYARKLYGIKQGEMPAGTFENVLSFVQELTEAARASKNSIVVASIPESEVEAGGEYGLIAMKKIEHTFGRMEAVWKPVVAEEGFEIVRRRLFKTITDTAAVEQVCNAFSEMYRDNPDDYPVECREAEYQRKMKHCYPIHPEVFDRLYNDWATLETFQKTRGVLRFMASVIHDLYVNNDGGSMIMPGSIPLGKPAIREELTRYLSSGWDSIIEQEIDGNRSKARFLDSKGTHYGKYMACSRITRSIFLGSAPDSREQRNRGLNASNIRLGVMQPGEFVATYNDATAKLTNELTYLYFSNNRYWFDTRPTLRKTVADRAQLQKPEDIYYELEKAIRSACKGKEPFDSVHIAPASSGDVPDQPAVRLVLLAPSQTHKKDDINSKAMAMVRDMLDMRGGTPRMYRNMVLFLAPDVDAINHVVQDMRQLMAWKSIDKDAEVLNLDAAQKRETKENITRLDDTIKDRIQDAYGWLLLPSQEGTAIVEWSVIRIAGPDNPVMKVTRQTKTDELLVEALSPKILLMEMEQYKLWKDRESIPIRELWEDYTRYLYLHRLTNYEVLRKTLESGVISGEYFAYADGQDGNGRYQGLCFGNAGYLHITTDGLLVKPDAAKRQIEKENAENTRVADIQSESGGTDESGELPHQETPEGYSNPDSLRPAKKNTHFYGSVRIDSNKLGSTAGQISQEVLQHINKLADVEVTVTLDIQVKIPDGVPDDIARTIRENCSVLKFETSEFGDK